MSKGMDRKRGINTKPAKTMLEKRAAKRARKANQAYTCPGAS